MNDKQAQQHLAAYEASDLLLVRDVMRFSGYENTDDWDDANTQVTSTCIQPCMRACVRA